MNGSDVQAKKRRFGLLLALFALLYIGAVMLFIIVR